MTTEKKIEEILTAFAIKNDNVVDPKEYKQLIKDKTTEIVKLFAIPVVSKRYSEEDMHKAYRGFVSGKKFEDWLNEYNGC